MKLTEHFYTKMDNSLPYNLLFVSYSNKIEYPFGIMHRGSMFYNSYTDSIYKSRGYETFCYNKCYSTADAKLSERFLAYPSEAKVFVMFHELMHNYITQKSISIPYDFEEAICDIVGNYGSLELSKKENIIDLILAQRQICINEEIYKIINRYILKINKHPKNKVHYHFKSYSKIQKQLINANDFQKDRFDYNINNAFLLKNKNYSENYFLLKKVFKKAKTIKNFIEIINSLPNNDFDCKKYLEIYI